MRGREEEEDRVNSFFFVLFNCASSLYPFKELPLSLKIFKNAFARIDHRSIRRGCFSIDALFTDKKRTDAGVVVFVRFCDT